MALKDLAPWHHGKSNAPATFGDLQREVDRVFETSGAGSGRPRCCATTALWRPDWR
jgi:hypothetical protein